MFNKLNSKIQTKKGLDFCTFWCLDFKHSKLLWKINNSRKVRFKLRKILRSSSINDEKLAGILANKRLIKIIKTIRGKVSTIPVKKAMK